MKSLSRCLEFALIALTLTACAREMESPRAAPQEPELLITLEGKSPEERCELILRAGESADASHAPALLRLMKDRSQVAFLADTDRTAPYGLRAVEFKDTGPDTRAMERVAAIAALGKLKCREALPDLLMALDDRHPVVANHAAAVLVGMGSRSGLPLLLSHLEGRHPTSGEFMASPAFAGETADELLQGLTGKTVTYNVDAGASEKDKAAQRWRALVAQMEQASEHFIGEGRSLQPGEHAELDRRVRFHVDLLGEMQFLYHEQARRMLQRMGVAALPYLREGVERMAASGDSTGLAGIAQVLGAIPHPNAEALLAELLKSRHGTVAARAAEAFGALATTGAVAALSEALQNAELQLAALSALGRTGKLGLPALQSFRTQDPDARTVHTLALFEATAAKSARTEAIALLASSNIADRNRALNVIKRVLGSDEGYVATGSEAERAAAIERLKKRLP
jgi:HEAT repeat protein